MGEKALKYLYKLLKEHRLALVRAEARKDYEAIENLNDKIECAEYLIALATKEL
jgi:hypothetical protein